ncbi:10577_t:CDS:2 [Entrophospora sp. SA101]|nr:10577_t:CDS:2 [Entrophospora sp. SA101]
MVPEFLPPLVESKCNEFVASFIENRVVDLPRMLSHNGMWKETDEELANVAMKILDTLNDSWNNPAFSHEFAVSQSEGTYVTNVIVPAIRATLNNLPLRKSTFVST